MSATPQEVFERLVHGVADGRWRELPGLYAADTLVTHPIDALGAPPLHGREQVKKHFDLAGEMAAATPVRREPRDIVVHRTADPEVIVAEFTYHFTPEESGETFDVPCVFVMRVRDGEIVESRDYIDPLARARGMGQLGELLAEISRGDRAGRP